MEGFFVNSAHPAANPNPAVVGLAGRGLVTALYAPLVTNFTANEYTWVMSGLLPIANTLYGTTTYTSYDVASIPSSFTVYEDPSQDARPTFYNCPADVDANDPRYSDGVVYLKGHFASFNSQYDTSTQTGTFNGTVSWDAGSHLVNLPGSRRLGMCGWFSAETVRASRSKRARISGLRLKCVGRTLPPLPDPAAYPGRDTPPPFGRRRAGLGSRRAPGGFRK